MEEHDANFIRTGWGGLSGMAGSEGPKVICYCTILAIISQEHVAAGGVRKKDSRQCLVIR